MGWVYLLRLVCTDGTRFMGSIELGQVGWGGPSIQTLVAFLPRRLLFQPARQQLVVSDASAERSEPTTTNIGAVPVGTWKPISILVQ